MIDRLLGDGPLLRGGASRRARRLPLDWQRATAIYSLRKLRTAYFGPLVRVRRSSDSAEQNIGANAQGELDTVALNAFLGASTAFVVTWYDQSGNGYNVTQATTANQPTLALTGIASRPAVLFGGTTVLIAAAGPYFRNVAGSTIFAAAKQSSLTNTDNGIILINGGTGVGRAGIRTERTVTRKVEGGGRRLDGDTFAGVDGAAADLAVHVHTAINNYATGSAWMYTDGSRWTGSLASSGGNTSDTNSTGMSIGGSPSGLSNFPGHIAEVVLLPLSAGATVHNAIGRNMASRYGLTWTTVT